MIRVINSKNLLGEGIYFKNEVLYWLDIERKAINFVNINKINQIETVHLPEMVSVIFDVSDNWVTVGSESGIVDINLLDSTWKVRTKEFRLDHTMRLNDGIQSQGIYLFGSMEKKPTGLNGSLYLSNGQDVKIIDQDIGIPNSFVQISESEFLISDSFEKIIYRYEIDFIKKEVIKKCVWNDFSSECFTPDGGDINSKNEIYIAMWGGSGIYKFDISGTLIGKIDIPALQPTNCCFSEDEKTIYVTSATTGLKENDINEYPLSGSVFLIDMESI
ncbi:SMP-30/gluconolactonase/LRE family protein [Photobacterium sp. WH24]|uniref:SMP-30/gluconolactonase/LRE family protein n=1 Tax=Photobacterium sp. WH24 TaxID=2827237 RepID=UPI001C471787|nr:SMP-30/gluconolactonase/LRE family protein [Photobacterium sp. WH24]MBV7260584.1 SMP-30/gluconolactonase/LRE family protein [Photobacterium sp. WH24]